MKFIITLFISLFFIPVIVLAQNNNTIRGVVSDKNSGAEISYASISINSLGIGTTSDSLGLFALNNIPVGRCDIEVRFIGYETLLMREVLVTS